MNVRLCILATKTIDVKQEKNFGVISNNYLKINELCMYDVTSYFKEL